MFEPTGGNTDSNTDPQKPLTRVIMKDFPEALRRIKKVEFLPDKVMIFLISDNLSVRFSILLLTMYVFQEIGFSVPFDLEQEWRQEFVTYDEELQALVIPIAGVKKLILSSGAESRLYEKQK